jgi:glycosyltransferase involved in cell wall biosynthesis
MRAEDRQLRIALLAYRGRPHVGGQGVYVRQLSKALVDLGHHVEVLGGQPYPQLDERVPLVELPSLDIYNDYYPMRMPGIWELKRWPDFVEVTAFSLGQFPEPLAFSLRAWSYLRGRRDQFDLVHDNQSLGYGLLGIERDGFPVIATVHHPITVDRRLEMQHAQSWYRRLSLHRWYSFTTMQTRVVRRLRRLVTVSESSFSDIVDDHGVDAGRMAVVPVGVDVDVFRPRPDIVPVPGRVVTTASADVTMKGLRYLLEAVAKLRTEQDDLHLVVIGKRKPGGSSDQAIRRLGLEGVVEFVSGVPEERIIELYAEAQLAVVPSLYEGFSLPAIEAMACGTPLVATSGGALPEVVGRDGETALLVPPGDSEALATRIRWALGRSDLRQTVGQAGRNRVVDHWSWRHTAERTVEQYRIRLEGRSRRPRQTTGAATTTTATPSPNGTTLSGSANRSRRRRPSSGGFAAGSLAVLLGGLAVGLGVRRCIPYTVQTASAKPTRFRAGAGWSDGVPHVRPIRSASYNGQG